jgi:hypothetical protein
MASLIPTVHSVPLSPTLRSGRTARPRSVVLTRGDVAQYKTRPGTGRGALCMTDTERGHPRDGSLPGGYRTETLCTVVAVLPARFVTVSVTS